MAKELVANFQLTPFEDDVLGKDMVYKIETICEGTKKMRQEEKAGRFRTRFRTMFSSFFCKYARPQVDDGKIRNGTSNIRIAIPSYTCTNQIY